MSIYSTYSARGVGRASPLQLVDTVVDSEPTLGVLFQFVQNPLYALEIDVIPELFPFFFGHFRIVLEIFLEFVYFHI